MRFGNLAAATLMAFVGVAGLCLDARAGNAGNARRDLMWAKDNAESQRWDDLDTNMKKATADMEGLSDAEKAPLLEQITEIKAIVTKSIEEDVTKRLDKAAAAGPGQDKLDIDRATMRLNADEAQYADPAAVAKLRARLASVSGGAAPPPSTPKPETPASPAAPAGAMSEQAATAASNMRTAHAMFDQGDVRMAESIVRRAVQAAQGAPEAERGPILADAAALTKQIDAADLKAQRDEEARRVDEQVSRYVGTADNSIQTGVVSDPEWIDKSQDLLASNDVKTYMDPARLKEYQAKLDAIRVKLRDHNKAAALERSAENLKELEEKVSANPFKGATEVTAHGIYTDLKALSDRVRAELRDGNVPKDDPEIKAAIARLDAANAKIDTAAGKWALQQTEQQFASSWKSTSNDFGGWEAEKLDPKAAAKRRVEGLDKTRRAISGSVYWLNQADNKQIVAKNKDDAVIASTVQAAQKTLDIASAKLNDAFNAVIAQAERAPMPDRESDRSEILWLAGDASGWFEGTKYKEANVARATALDAKWKAEVAQAEKEQEATLKKLTAQADAAWPAIEASVAPDKGFNPSEAQQWKGKIIEVKGYYNRSGWDFDGAYDWAATIKGTAVAGNYDPRVRQAFDEGSRHTKFGINDHVGWDVIAIVEGPGQIKRRTKIDWRDKETHELILKTESYVAEPCVVIKVIGLHAGPVAVGPK